MLLLLLACWSLTAQLLLLLLLHAAGMKGFWYSYSNIFALLKVRAGKQQCRSVCQLFQRKH
jgi:hypothetical protein